MSIVPPTKSRLIVRRNGRAITGTIPKPVVIVDTREQLPLSFDKFPNWIAGEKVATLKVADYSVEGMESIMAIERKSLPDLLGTLTHRRPEFFRMCEKLADFRWKAILIEATYEELKSPYTGTFSSSHPNGIVGTVDAVEAKFGIPIIYTSSNRALVEEKAASWLSKHYTYYHLETNGLGRVLQDDDGL